MRDSRQSWLLYHNAKLWKTRPSKLLAIEDEYVAYCLDEAISFFGGQLEYELDEASHGKVSKEERSARAKRQTVLDRVLGKIEGDKPAYADPATMFK